jgi:general secretion pathway protein B
MILDALTRAEHERQLEKQPDLKFVTPVKPNKNNPSKLWMWIGLGVLVNGLILGVAINLLSEDTAPNEVAVQNPVIGQQKVIEAPMTQVTPELPTLQQEASQLVSMENTRLAENVIPDEATPLAMEANRATAAEVDRPLIYEAKQANTNSTSSKTQSSVEVVNAAMTKKKGNVSFSSTELNADDALPIANKPKLLIDGVSNNSNNVPKVSDLPETSRASLSQYEVNVHVFDDDPARRFVLINMDKYKEGDRIANNGPLVQEITAEGVVVDYGSGSALLPPK